MHRLMYHTLYIRELDVEFCGECCGLNMRAIYLNLATVKEDPITLAVNSSHIFVVKLPVIINVVHAYEVRPI
jgi:hypothetical protein